MSIRSDIEKVLDGAGNLNPQLNSFLSIERDHSLARSAELDANSGSRLNGLAVAVKDNICTKGMRTSCGSQILHNYKAQYDATAIRRLNDAGAIIVGKTNMDEFAMGSSNESSAFGRQEIPGMSRGFLAAVQVAPPSQLHRAWSGPALGSETGGSVRQPASLCGVVGFKPTYGRISRYGLVAFASSLDNIGIFGQTSRDVADVLGVIAGRDPLDATSADVPVPDYSAGLSGSIEGKRIGVPRALLGEGLEDDVRVRVTEAIDSFQSLGAAIVDVELPHAKYGIAVYYIIATAEASSNLARYDGVRYGFRAEEADELRKMYFKTREEGFGAEVKRRIMLGTYVLSSGYYDAYYSKAQKVRALVKHDYEVAFRSCDAILTPTSPTVAFKLGERSDDPIAMYLSDIYTVSANLSGVPAISVPCGLSSDGLPIGLQLVGNFWSEGDLLNMAHTYETAHPLGVKPPIYIGL
jgi:aspartyl-tRNA(Asn)/glutamyl-tRNA(Gln) amidotransferase subunit A